MWEYAATEEQLYAYQHGGVLAVHGHAPRPVVSGITVGKG
jgi:hypothetical protein